MDGRATNLILGSPGGDAGIIFRFLRAAQIVLPEVQFPANVISDILIACHKHFNHKIYFHTDDHAIHHYDPATSKNYDDAVVPQNIGCGYFKVCTNFPEKLQEDEKMGEFAKTFLKTLIQTIQEHPDLFEVTCLHGDHVEKFVKKTASLEPLQADGVTFIYHFKAEENQGPLIFDAVAEVVPAILGQKNEILAKFDEVCDQHWSHAIGLLAPGIEIQTV